MARIVQRRYIMQPRFGSKMVIAFGLLALSSKGWTQDFKCTPTAAHSIASAGALKAAIWPHLLEPFHVSRSTGVTVGGSAANSCCAQKITVYESEANSYSVISSIGETVYEYLQINRNERGELLGSMPFILIASNAVINGVCELAK